VARQARRAATETQQEIERSLRIGELSSASRLVGEIQALVMAQRLDAAALRLNDLRQRLVEVRAVAALGGFSSFSKHISVVGSLEQSVVEAYYSGEALDPLYLHRKLREVADFVNGLVVATQIRPQEGNDEST